MSFLNFITVLVGFEELFFEAYVQRIPIHIIVDHTSQRYSCAGSCLSKAPCPNPVRVLIRFNSQVQVQLMGLKFSPTSSPIENYVLPFPSLLFLLIILLVQPGLGRLPYMAQDRRLGPLNFSVESLGRCSAMGLRRTHQTWCGHAMVNPSSSTANHC